MVAELHEVTAHHPDIYHAGYTQDALKEYVEAHATAALRQSADSATGLAAKMSGYRAGLLGSAKS